MAIPASKVRAICTASEAELVRASRKSELDQLNHAEVEKLLGQARKLFRKWRDLGRGQARARSQKVGFGEKAANTKLKVELFGDTVKRLEVQLAKLDKAAAGAKPASLTKKDRSAEHRATRAAVRKGMTAAGDLENETKFKKRKLIANTAAKAPAAKPVAAKPAPSKATAPQPAVAKSPKKAVAASKRTIAFKPSAVELVESRSLTNVATLIPQKKLPSKVSLLNPAKQRRAITAAKQSRVIRSGKTTRTMAHISARGKRNQARRDAKN
jgi:hypothetical protein